MKTLYLVSSEPYSGKGWLSLMLLSKCKQSGLKIGYYRPVGTMPVKVDGITTDEDMMYINNILKLGLDNDILGSTVFLAEEIIESFLRATDKDLQAPALAAFKKVSKDKDLVVVGGAGCFFFAGSVFGLSPTKLAELFDAKVLLTFKYKTELVDSVIAAKHVLGSRMVGVVINAIPEDKLDLVQNHLIPFLEKNEISVFGAIPYDRVLSSVSVEELQNTLNAEIICGQDKLDGLVEHFCIGAMHTESALKYFRQVVNKTVITGGDRTDIQLAALETPTTCLVLTGYIRPNPIILSKAESVGVPLLLVKDDTLTTVEKIERMLGKLPVRGEKKLKSAQQLFDKYFAYDRLMKLI